MALHQAAAGFDGFSAASITRAGEGAGRVNLTVFLIFMAAAALLGGSSRYDAIQIVLLQPLAWLAAGVAAIRLQRSQLAGLGLPLALVLAMAVLLALQLVPLGLDQWSGLPGREPLVRAAEAIGNTAARPLSMVPWRTVNAFAGIGIPLAALLLFAALGPARVRLAALGVVVVALVSAALGVLQLATGGASLFYLYEFTNAGSAVGLFANRNHTAIFLALAMVVIGRLQAGRRKDRANSATLALLWASFGLLLLLNLVNGSRAGLIATVMALAATGWMQLRTVPVTPAGQAAAAPARRRLAAMVTAGIALVLAGLLTLAERLPGYSRLVEANPLDDLRFQVLPDLVEMAQTYFPFGIGFGAFERVYRIHERSEMLLPTYLNMAHNDWLQFAIEGSLPGLVILLLALGWCGVRIARLWGPDRNSAIAGAAVVLIVALASYFDYPLRAPLFQVTVILTLLALLAPALRRPQDRPAVTPGNTT